MTRQKRALFLFCLLGLLLFRNTVSAQIADGSLPKSFRSNLKATPIIPHMELAPVDVKERIDVDIREGVRNRYGIVESLDLDIKEVGAYSQVDDIRIWRFGLNSENALSLGLTFSTFNVPDGAALYIYTPDREVVRGAFTSENEKQNGKFTIGDFKGDTVIVEYNEPNSASFQGGVIIGSVVKAYRSFATKASERIQINCPEGQDWQNEKRAVCMITFNDSQYSYYCSGSLVNNTREDGTAYFLTANHCISNSSEASSMVAYFNYENSTCESSDSQLNQSISGAQLLASSQYSDFSLLQLQEYPSKEYNPYFAGWDVSGDPASTGTCIHHPQGTPKCIALDYDPLFGNSYSIRWDDGTVSQPNSHWVADYDAGNDEGGSSGAPLFDENKHIVGQLHGGDDSESFFGKFSLSWDYRSDLTEQLKHWLDPDNTGVEMLDGLEAFSKPVAAFSVEVPILCLSEVLRLTDESKFSPVTWSWEITPATYVFENGTSAASQNPDVRFLNEGVYSVHLTVTNANGSDDLVGRDLVSVFAELPVKLTGMPDEMTLCGWELDGYEFVAEGAPEFIFGLTADSKFDTSVSDNVLTVSLSDAGREGGSFDTYVKVTGTQGACSNADSVLIHVIVPENDNVAQAVPLKLGNNGIYSNECGTVEDNEPEPGTSGCSVENNWCPPSSAEVLDNSVWFYFEGPSSGFIKIETEGIDSQIAVYRANSPESLLSGSSALYTLEAASDKGIDGTQAAAIENLKVRPGVKYWLQVDGTDGSEGEFGLTLKTNSIEVYPNPSSGLYHLTVASIHDGTAKMDVYNHAGQQVYSGTGIFSQDANTVDFDLSLNPAGIYYFRVTINDEVMAKKLILVK